MVAEDKDYIVNMVEKDGKKLWLAYILAMITGMVGGHRFYLGKYGTGATQLIVSFMGYHMTAILVGFIPLFIIFIWLLIDLIKIPGMIKKENRQEVVRIIRKKEGVRKNDV